MLPADTWVTTTFAGSVMVCAASACWADSDWLGPHDAKGKPNSCMATAADPTSRLATEGGLAAYTLDSQHMIGLFCIYTITSCQPGYATVPSAAIDCAVSWHTAENVMARTGT